MSCINSPRADPSVLDASMTTLVDDGLLRISTGCTDPAFSLTLNSDCSNVTSITVQLEMKDHFIYRSCL